jgi:hypothetical protein
MTRRHAAPPVTASPTVPDLIDAPELAAIILLEHALDVAASALVAEHMTLIDDFHRPREQGPVVSLAHTICRRAGALRDTLARYRSAVRDAAASDDDDYANDDDFTLLTSILRLASPGPALERQRLPTDFESVAAARRMSPQISSWASTSLRRTFNDLARAAQVSDLVTRSISGHLTERMQKHYSTVNATQQREALAKAIRLFAPTSASRSGEESGVGPSLSQIRELRMPRQPSRCRGNPVRKRSVDLADRCLLRPQIEPGLGSVLGVVVEVDAIGRSTRALWRER